ncbi:DUF4097 domain-containing protein [Sphingobacterium sp. SRCM116780]|uniref:DUF4097 family beta strand repeat-containing protein n=1 Tax=Sphingobacterium sp. SRCM116780 TaxID=2907623 RepID=UPI001F2A14D2|nr:DUF4097 family beta strand repeat-containing protein [Sphingobacterium sp. SRCM116780]UIR56535.1 DUF4097 domain-containing protein [Sphingobacterium sp. SRCM116780]
MKKISVLIGIMVAISNLLQAQENTESIVKKSVEMATRSISGLPIDDSVEEGPKTWKEFKVSNPGNKLLIKFSQVYVEGYNGKEILFEAKVEDREQDERVKGLRVINSSELKDNSGIGLNITTKDQVTEVSYVGFALNDSVRIKIPDHMAVSIMGDKGTAFLGGNVELKNLKNEVEVSALLGNVKLVDITGPTNVKITQGDVEARFVGPVKGPISLIASMGTVDIALPAKIGANVDISTSMGNIYAGDEFQFEKSATAEKPVLYNNQVKGKMNGGGRDIILKTSMGDIYIRNNSK